MEDFFDLDYEVIDFSSNELKYYFQLLFKIREYGYTSFSLNRFTKILNEHLSDTIYLDAEDILGQFVMALDYFDGIQMVKRAIEDSEQIIYLEFTKEEAIRYLACFGSHLNEEQELLSLNLSKLQK